MRSILTLVLRTVVPITAASLVLAACGDNATTDDAGSGGPTIVVTTNILGDIVEEVVGDLAAVEVIMPLGADPHDFAPSARQAEAMAQADLLVVNGAGFEEGMESIIAAATASGVATFVVADHVQLLEFTGEHGPGDNEGGASEDDEHIDDPHLWTDPTRIASAVEALAGELADVDGIDVDGVTARAEGYLQELADLDAELEAILADVPVERRVLVTNHEVFGYFADRYAFEVVGAVVPSLTTGAEPSAADIEALAELISDQDIPAIFAETTQSTALADALADAVGSDVAVVELFSESLGEDGSGAETYVAMMRSNADRITEALR